MVWIETLKGFGVALIPPIIRSLTGWAQNASKDGKWERFEVLQLGETVLRVLLITATLFFGWGKLFGIDPTVFGAGMSAVLIDMMLPKKK